MAVRDEISNELEPVGGAIEDVRIGKWNQNPARKLRQGGLGDVPGDAAAGGMPPWAPDSAVDLHGHLGIRPGKIRAIGRRPTRPQALLLLVRRPRAPHRDGVFPLEWELREGDEPLV